MSKEQFITMVNAKKAGNKFTIGIWKAGGSTKKDDIEMTQL